MTEFTTHEDETGEESGSQAPRAACQAEQAVARQEKGITRECSCETTPIDGFGSGHYPPGETSKHTEKGKSYDRILPQVSSASRDEGYRAGNSEERKARHQGQLRGVRNRDVPNGQGIVIGTGRIAGYRVAVSAVTERPLVGHGIGQVTVEGAHNQSVEIHSLWLKWAAYCGVLAPALFAIMVTALVRKGLWLALDRSGYLASTTAAVLLVVVTSGLLASLFEANALIASFQYTAVWWAATGILLGIYARVYGGEFRLLPGWRV